MTRRTMKFSEHATLRIVSRPGSARFELAFPGSNPREPPEDQRLSTRRCAISNSEICRPNFLLSSMPFGRAGKIIIGRLRGPVDSDYQRTHCTRAQCLAATLQCAPCGGSRWRE
jgi:hypothetical protein